MNKRDKLYLYNNRVSGWLVLIINKMKIEQPQNSNKLGLALNFSVLFYELKNDSSKACKIAEEVFNKVK